MLMLIMKVENIFRTKKQVSIKEESHYPNGEKLIGNCYYPGNADVYAGSCNNAIVKILI